MGALEKRRKSKRAAHCFRIGASAKTGTRQIKDSPPGGTLVLGADAEVRAIRAGTAAQTGKRLLGLFARGGPVCSEVGIEALDQGCLSIARSSSGSG